MQASVFAELKRRRVFRALIGYGIAAFAVLQIIEPIMHGLHWPDSVLSYVVAALALGFPLVVTLAWIFDVNEGRIERTTPAAGPRGARVAILLVGIGIAAATPGVLWYFYLRDGRRPAAEASTPSIAVLPFVNLSSDREQEYFSDGISEEILNALAQIDGLRVIGRTSSFSLKGKNEDLRVIGQKLDVANLLEGSVRKSGTRVRITAQLVSAANGSHVWSQEFDRQLTDVFAVQEEIAKAVVTALKPKLLAERRTPLEEQRTANTEAYDQYLLGRHFLARGSGDGFVRAVKALEKAVSLDPNYAAAWSALSVAQFWASDQDPLRNDPTKGFPRARFAAERAIALAPNMAEGWAARGSLRTTFDEDWAGARADLERALALSPGSVDVRIAYAWLLGTLGNPKEAIEVMRKATAADPLSAASWMEISGFYLGTGEVDEAVAAAQRALELSPEHGRAARNLGFAFLLSDRFSEARAAFERSSNELFRRMGEAMVEHSLGHAAESRRALDRILATRTATQAAYQIAQVYAWRGEADEAFRWLDVAVQHHDAGLAYLKYDPLLRQIRGDPRYTATLEKLKLPLD
ncbi:MAG TPA: tetratricopeptide repeat protein [Myxococcales bacterium]|nr:tetratricopeptide repeat protein [Myxococcales bacterium]